MTWQRELEHEQKTHTNTQGRGKRGGGGLNGMRLKNGLPLRKGSGEGRRRSVGSAMRRVVTSTASAVIHEVQWREDLKEECGSM